MTNELISQLQLERSWIEGLLAKLTEEQMEMPGVEGDWAVKDIIAHLTIWERRGTQWIEWATAVAQGVAVNVPQAGYSAKDVDRLNLETYQQNKDRPLEDILEEFKRSFAPLIKQVQALRENDLEKTVQADWTDGKLVTVAEIVAWRYWHYHHHRKKIEVWINSLGHIPHQNYTKPE